MVTKHCCRVPQGQIRCLQLVARNPEFRKYASDLFKIQTFREAQEGAHDTLSVCVCESGVSRTRFGQGRQGDQK